MFDRIIDWWTRLNAPRPNPEPGPCESGECGQALDEARQLRTKIQILCAVMAGIKAIVDAALFIIGISVPLLIAAVIIGWIVPAFFVTILAVIAAAILLPMALAPVAQAVGSSLSTAIARAQQVAASVANICPPECYDDEALPNCPLANYQVPNVLAMLLP